MMALPVLAEEDRRLVEAFLDAAWAEAGLAAASRDGYRRDLAGLARWRAGQGAGLAGIGRDGLFDYLAWRAAEGYSCLLYTSPSPRDRG